jgi:hypothetical protein
MSWGLVRRLEGDLEVRNGDHLLLSYRWLPKLAPGAPETLRRSCYVEKLFDPSGIDVLDDFPKDHLHHRGISWMWPVVLIDGRRHDLWLLQGIEQRFEEIEHQMTSGAAAAFSCRNGWYAGGSRVISESVRIEASSANLGHLIDFTFSWEAIGRPVTLGGQPEGNKGYGGFGIRFAPHEDVTITTSSGMITEDSLHERYSWVDYSARFRGATAISGVTILPHPSNEGFPNEWICRFYGYVGECWPGLGRLTLEPGRPRGARYRVFVHANPAGDCDISGVAAQWARLRLGG